MLKGWALFFIIFILIVIGITFSFIVIKKNVNVNNESKKNIVGVKEDKIDELQMEKIILNTDDGVEIVGDYYPVVGSKFAGILLHMMPATRKSYTEVSRVLNEAGWSVLSIDLRGHGESINSSRGKLNYEKFTDKEHQGSIFDISSASNFLKSKGFAVDSQFLIGASIGANLSLKFLSENKDIKTAILISPGLNYKGILTEPLMSNEISNKVLLVSSTGDVDSYGAVKLLKEKYQNSELMIFAGEGHGTDIFKNYKDSTDKVVNWLKGKLI